MMRVSHVRMPPSHACGPAEEALATEAAAEQTIWQRARSETDTHEYDIVVMSTRLHGKHVHRCEENSSSHRHAPLHMFAFVVPVVL